MSRVPGLFGRTAPHPRSTHPRVKLDAHLVTSQLPPIPATVDRATKVSQWPMYLNDSLGDCTCAAVGHELQAWSAYSGTEITAPDAAVLKLYEAMGYVPGDPGTDNGANIQDVLQYWHSTGFDGHKISAFAELEDFYDSSKLKAALYLFGSVYLGINCPDSAQSQFSQGQPWDYVPGAQIEGGHAIVLQKMTNMPGHDPANMDIVTWGALQPMTGSFAKHYVEEAWVVISPDWIEKNGKDVDGFSLSALMSDFKAIA
jgi:hypothetical protein